MYMYFRLNHIIGKVQALERCRLLRLGVYHDGLC